MHQPVSQRISGATYVGVPHIVKTGSVTTIARPKSPSFSLQMSAASRSIWDRTRKKHKVQTEIETWREADLRLWDLRGLPRVGCRAEQRTCQQTLGFTCVDLWIRQERPILSPPKKVKQFLLIWHDYVAKRPKIHTKLENRQSKNLFAILGSLKIILRFICRSVCRLQIAMILHEKCQRYQIQSLVVRLSFTIPNGVLWAWTWGTELETYDRWQKHNNSWF